MGQHRNLQHQLKNQASSQIQNMHQIIVPQARQENQGDLLQILNTMPGSIRPEVQKQQICSLIINLWRL